MLLRSLLTEPIFLAGLLGFLLENTIPGKLRPGPSRLEVARKSSLPELGNGLTNLCFAGTKLERGLCQGLPSPFTAQEAQMPQKSREKVVQDYELPFPLQNLCPCIPQPVRCLCPLPEDPGNEEGGPTEPGETANLLPGFGEQCPRSSREELRSH